MSRPIVAYTKQEGRLMAFEVEHVDAIEAVIAELRSWPGVDRALVLITNTQAEAK